MFLMPLLFWEDLDKETQLYIYSIKFTMILESYRWVRLCERDVK